MKDKALESLKAFKDSHTKKYENLLKINEETRLILLKLAALGLVPEDEYTYAGRAYTRNVLVCRASYSTLQWVIRDVNGNQVIECLQVQIRKATVLWRYGKQVRNSYRLQPEKTVKRGDFEIPLEIIDYINLNKDKLKVT